MHSTSVMVRKMTLGLENHSLSTHERRERRLKIRRVEIWKRDSNERKEEKKKKRRREEDT